MRGPRATRGLTKRLLPIASIGVLLAAACAPAAPSPTAAPAKPAATQAPAKTESKTAPTTAPAQAQAKPTEKPAAKAETQPAAKAAEKPAAKEAQPAAKVDTKAVEEFYRGKTVRIITGFTPGGLFDGWSRMLAKHMPKHIPGNPNMVVENMPGAGSMTAANHVYNVAPKDGTVIGNFLQSLILNQVRQVEGMEVDMRQFQWLGAVASVTVGCIAREETGVQSLADTMPPSSKQVIMGTSAVGSTGYDYPVLMKHVLGANLKIVSGYPGNAQVRLGIESGELDGYCVAWEVLKPTLEPWREAGTPKVNIFVQAPQEKNQPHPEMQDVPILWDFIQNPDDERLFRLLMAPEAFYWPFAMPPGTPPMQVQAMRDGMAAAFEDPQLLEEAKQSNWDHNFVPPQKIQTIIGDVLDTPEPIKARFKQILESQQS